MNRQPIEKRVVEPNGYLDVHSIFHTIQGEGPFCGTPCVFIRLAGCNLQCPACDTDYTSDRRTMSVGAILCEVNNIRKSGLVVITGGEPFRQDLEFLFSVLCVAGYYVQVETNGTLKPTHCAPGARWTYNSVVTLSDYRRRYGVYVVCSPKTGKIDPAIYLVACAFKYVIRAGSLADDGLPLSALEHPSNPFPARPPHDWNGLVYVQPLDEKHPALNNANRDVAVAMCIQHGYTLQLQIHKLIGVE